MAESAASAPARSRRSVAAETPTGPAAASRDTAPVEEDATSLPGPLSVRAAALPAATSTSPPLVTLTEVPPWRDAKPAVLAAMAPFAMAVLVSSAVRATRPPVALPSRVRERPECSMVPPAVSARSEVGANVDSVPCEERASKPPSAVTPTEPPARRDAAPPAEKSSAPPAATVSGEAAPAVSDAAPAAASASVLAANAPAPGVSAVIELAP